MSEISDRYRRLSSAFAAHIAAVPADLWSAPTPCADWTAIELVQHVVDSRSMFLGLVGRPAAEVPPVGDDPAAAWAAASAAVQADLEDPGLAAVTFQGFSGESSFETAVDRFVSFDLVVHGWDLARATGGDERIDPDEVTRVVEDAALFGDMLHSPGVCGPAIEVPADADPQTAMLALLGRSA